MSHRWFEQQRLDTSRGSRFMHQEGEDRRAATLAFSSTDPQQDPGDQGEQLTFGKALDDELEPSTPEGVTLRQR